MGERLGAKSVNEMWRNTQVSSCCAARHPPSQRCAFRDAHLPPLPHHAHAAGHIALAPGLGPAVSFYLVWAGQSGTVHRVSDRRWGTVDIYDSTGQFIRLVDGRGHGPGEYQLGEVVMVTLGDSLFVFDGLGPSLTVVSPDYRYARSVYQGCAPSRR